MGGHCNYLALFQMEWFLGNLDFHLAVKNLNQSIKRRGMFTEPLAHGKRKQSHRSCIFLYDGFADYRSLLIIDHFSQSIWYCFVIHFFSNQHSCQKDRLH
jgi:hypothetical protein